VSLEVKLKASPEQVWNALIDNPGWSEWHSGASSCQDTSPSTGLGSTRRIVVNDLQVDEEIIGWGPNHLWALSVYETNKPLSKCWIEPLVLEPTKDNETLIRYDAALQLVFFAKLIQRFVVSEKAWSENLARIDEYVETKENHNH
jgi:hypothetical protein